MDAHLRPPDRLIRLGRLLLTRTRVTDATIATLMGVSPTDRRRIVAAEGWPARPASPRRPALRSPASFRSLRAFERFILGRLQALDADVAAGRSTDPEKQARAVTQFVRALQAARAYFTADVAKDQARHDEGPPARTLSQLRDDLRGHLLRIRDERRSRGGGGEAESEQA